MADRIELTLSVHGLVDFLLRKGDIDSRIYNQDTMQLGAKMHAAYQKKQGKEYLSEVELKEAFDRPKGTITLEGRADGIIVGGSCPVIDEIKTTVAPLEDFYEEQKEWHYGQAECYALMYAHANKANAMTVRLTYISQNDGSQTVKEETIATYELEERVNLLLDEYLDFYASELARKEKRNLSAGDLAFPYGSMRPGQRKMAERCYRAAMNGGISFVEAPTGIGKTMGSLFPTVKALGKGGIDKIFYLTAKTTGRESASEAMGRIYQAGFKGRDSFLIAKEKICFNPGGACNPDECPFAKGYYDKVGGILRQAVASGERFSYAYVRKLAMENAVCPFELQLDLSLYSDVVICDYNYLFDPLVHLERFFDEGGGYERFVALVDEAHNLLDRGREMYGASFSSLDVSFVRRDLRKIAAPGIKRALKKLSDAILDVASLKEEGEFALDSVPSSLTKAIDSLSNAMASYGKGNEKKPKLPDSLSDLSREAHRLYVMNEQYFSHSRFLVAKGDRGVYVSVLCLDPSEYLFESVAKLHGAVFFSATLSPIDYYASSLLGMEGGQPLVLSSPFPKENLNVMVAPNISTRYADRELTMPVVASYLKAFVEGKIGNYFAYFPSYEYLDKIRPLLDFGDADVYVQENEMDELSRDRFLLNFKPHPERSAVGLLVMGGAFSEGIDMKGDRLIGVAVVGVGMPKICFEKDQYRKYFDEKNGKGFQYAYTNPGMNKVMQAVGRLIRSETDRGSALLIDDRYLRKDYQSLFEGSWSGRKVVFSEKDIRETLASFYKKKPN